MPPKVLLSTPPLHHLRGRCRWCSRWWWRRHQWLWHHHPLALLIMLAPAGLLQASNQSGKQNTFSHAEGQDKKKFMHRCIDAKQLSSTWESCCWCQGGLGIFLFCGIFLVWGRMRAGGIGGSGTGNTSCKSDSTSLSTTLVLTWVDSTSIYTRYA